MIDEDAAGRTTRLVIAAASLLARFTRPLFLGVRGVVLDRRDRVLLVRHSYVPGWHLPGGGVEVGETVAAALARELAEEGNIALDGPPALHGLFFNRRFANRDHIAVYVVRQFHQTAARQPDREIVETGFFAHDDLPERTTRAVAARLAEVFGAAPISPVW